MGQETLRRFKYQIDYVVLRWIKLLAENDASAIYCERHEDLEIVSAEIGSERVQVKTLQGRNWTLVRMTSDETPVLQSFAQQFAADQSLGFRFVTNAPGSQGGGEVGRAAVIFDKLRAGHPLSSAEQSQKKEVLRRTGKRVKVAGVGPEQLLMNTTFDFEFCGIGDLELRVQLSLRTLVEVQFKILLPDRDLQRLYRQLFGTVFMKSSAQQGLERRLDAGSLLEIISVETRKVEVGPEVNLRSVGEDVTRLLKSAQLAGSDLEPGEETAALTEDEEKRLKRLQERLLAPSNYTITSILVSDRKELSEFLARQGDDSLAARQLEQALQESGTDDPDLFCTTVYAYANFLFGNRQDPGPILGYLDQYFEQAKVAFSYRWVEASHILSYLKLADASAVDERISSFKGFLTTTGREKLDDLRDRLHYDEALMALEAITGSPTGALERLRSLLAEVDQEPIYDHERLRLKVVSLEPFLAAEQGFDEVFDTFASYYESKNAWGERADLYKQRSLSAYQRGDYGPAIKFARVAAEGYRRVNATRGFLLTWHVIGHCYEQLDLKAAALQEFLGLAIAALFNRVHDLGVNAIMEASRMAFDLGSYDDSLSLMLGHVRLAWAFGLEDEVALSFTNIGVAMSAVATSCDDHVVERAASAVKEVVADDVYRSFIDEIVGAAMDTDERWRERLKVCDDETSRESMAKMREVLHSRRLSGDNAMPLQYSVRLEDFDLVADWSGERRLRNLVLGLCAGLERFSDQFLPILRLAGSRLSIETVDFDDISDLADRHDWVEGALEHRSPAVLAGMRSDGSPKVVVAVTSDLWEESLKVLGEGLEPMVRGFALAVTLAVYYGSEVEETTERVRTQVQEPNDFALATCPDVATAIEFLGWHP